MLAAVVNRKGGPFSLEPVKIEEPREDEILVKMKAVGICHSDICCRDQIFPAVLPQVFGHEGAGIVEQVGSKISRLKPGDHVVLTFNSCGHCPSCDTDMPAYCRDFDQLNASGSRIDGSSALSVVDEQQGDASNDIPARKNIAGHFFGQSSFAEYALVSERNAVKVDKDIDLTIAAPFACAVQTGAGCVFNTFSLNDKHSILIIGAGGVGLSALMAAKVAGAKTIIAVDLHDHRLALAQELGATDVINPNKHNVEELVRKKYPQGIDFSVECSGAVAVQELALSVLNNQGICALLGVPGVGQKFSVPCYHLNIGRTVKGVVAGDSNPQQFLPYLLELHKTGQLPAEKLITSYPFADINQAADDLVSGKVVKPVLTFD